MIAIMMAKFNELSEEIWRVDQSIQFIVDASTNPFTGAAG